MDVIKVIVLREGAQAGVVIVHGQADLLEVVGALNLIGSLADFLHCRQEQGNQGADNGNDHQQLDEREATPPRGLELTHGLDPFWKTDSVAVTAAAGNGEFVLPKETFPVPSGKVA